MHACLFAGGVFNQSCWYFPKVEGENGCVVYLQWRPWAALPFCAIQFLIKSLRTWTIAPKQSHPYLSTPKESFRRRGLFLSDGEVCGVFQGRKKKQLSVWAVSLLLGDFSIKWMIGLRGSLTKPAWVSKQTGLCLSSMKTHIVPLLSRYVWLNALKDLIFFFPLRKIHDTFGRM